MLTYKRCHVSGELAQWQSGQIQIQRSWVQILAVLIENSISYWDYCVANSCNKTPGLASSVEEHSVCNIFFASGPSFEPRCMPGFIHMEIFISNNGRLQILMKCQRKNIATLKGAMKKKLLRRSHHVKRNIAQ